MIDVSVIIPIYNPDLKLLEKAIESVLSQEVLKELIIVNDGSEVNGNPLSLLSKYPNGIIYLTKENGGPASARNFGIKHAKGYYICFLDQDDIYTKHSLKDKLTYMKKNPNIGGCLTLPVHYDNESKCYKEWVVLDEIKNGEGKKIDLGGFCEITKKYGYFFPNGFICTKVLFDNLGLLDTNSFGCDELDFYLRIIRFSELHFYQKATFVREKNNTSSSECYFRKMWFGKLSMVENHKNWALGVGSFNDKHQFALLHDMVLRKCIKIHLEDRNWESASSLVEALIYPYSVKNLFAKTKYLLLIIFNKIR